jgi:transcriptional regulator with XRE-family HTH domain
MSQIGDMPRPNLKLRNARVQRHWSQEQAAAAIGIDRKTYNRWERGLCFPQPKLLDAACKAFGTPAEALGFDSLLEASSAEYRQNLVIAGSGGRSHFLTNGETAPATASTLMLLQDIIDRNFIGDFTEDFLVSNIKTMNFREEWQFIVNNVVAEEKVCLRAMVFDVELTRWWNTIAGQMYMMTNMDLLKRKIPIKRIFILHSIDARLRMNTLINAYVHHKLGIEVKVSNLPNFQESIPFKPDMFSVHDNLFVTLYYFSGEKHIANLLLDDKHISEFTSFYDEIFADDRLCMDIEPVLKRYHCPESFWSSVKMQMEMLRSLEKVSCVTELVKKQ